MGYKTSEITSFFTVFDDTVAESWTAQGGLEEGSQTLKI
jgi:hypothetical protein